MGVPNPSPKGARRDPQQQRVKYGFELQQSTVVASERGLRDRSVQIFELEGPTEVWCLVWLGELSGITSVCVRGLGGGAGWAGFHGRLR